MPAWTCGDLIEKHGSDTLQDIVAGRCGECIVERLLKRPQRSIA